MATFSCSAAPIEMPSPERQELSLNDAATHVLEECRTVVPGMQALFGFQLIAVFSATFKELSSAERTLHLAAIVLVTRDRAHFTNTSHEHE